MNITKRILLRKHCLSFLAEDNLCFYIMKSGSSDPQMYILIEDTPYENPTIRHLTITEVSKLIGVSYQAILIGLS
ncbi:MAG: hypothetical protein WC827_03870 [Candidatus Paceibacterota bacterium]|jgi:hypothetical protein